LLHCRSIQST